MSIPHRYRYDMDTVLPKPRALWGYYGGKAEIGPHRKGKWIVDLLPTRIHTQTYIEPFAGMYSVGLMRGKVSNEIANDANERIINFLRCVRDYPDDMAWKLSWTPRSQQEFLLSKDRMDDKSLTDMERALAFFIVSSQSILHGDAENANFAMNVDPIRKHRRILPNTVLSLATRLMNVQLLNKDACDVLERTINADYAVIYCDPPYLSSENTNVYHVRDFNRPRMLDALLKHKAQVAVSGYEEDWPELPEAGWEVNKLDVATWIYRENNGSKKYDRVECLWTNYVPERKQGILIPEGATS